MPLAFGFGNPVDWVIIFAFALIIFGPNKLPEIGKQLGQAMREFRKLADDLTGAAQGVRDDVESVYKPILRPPAIMQTTSSATVESVVTHKPYDQEPHDLMAPAVQEVSSEDVKGH